MKSRTVIIIGSGLNGLVTACYLAKAGLKPLVLEQRSTCGGAFATEEFYPGFRASLANSIGVFPPQISKDLRLDRRGLEFTKPPVLVSAIRRNEAPICLYDDPKRTASELNQHSRRDSEKYPEFISTFARIG